MSERLRKLEVRLEHGPDDGELVGRLAEHERTIYFEYDASFLGSGRSISPLKLPATAGVVAAPTALGLHGVFADVLPDGWGLLLMDRFFRAQGLVPERLSSLDRLAYLGTRTMGALTFHPCTAEPGGELPPLGLQRLASEADKVLEGRASELLPELLAAGGSPAGARPKVLVSVRGDSLIYGADPPRPGYEAWLIKFAARSEPRDTGAIEYVYSRLARRAGLDVPESRLFVGEGGARYFGVRRFDRPAGGRLHVHTLAGVLHADFRTPNLDYDLLLRVTRRLTRAQPEVERAFRQLVFNVLAHNRDDHGKNFSFVMQRGGEWTLSPAYDLTFSEGPGGEHTMAVLGEARQPRWEHMLRLAATASIAEGDARRIVDEVREALARWPEEARAVDISAATSRKLGARLQAAGRAAQVPGTEVVRPARRRAPRR